MENNKTSSITTSKNERPTKSKSVSSKMKYSQLMKLFEVELKDIYWAEKTLKTAIPNMIKNATSKQLIEALTSHLKETESHIKRLEQVFEILGKKAVAVKCEAMAGLVKEASEIMEDCEAGAMCDAVIIAAGQKVEHYKIASYGTLHQFAETLGLKIAATILEKTLNEEKAANQKLTEVAVSIVNVKAPEEELAL